MVVDTEMRCGLVRPNVPFESTYPKPNDMLYLIDIRFRTRCTASRMGSVDVRDLWSSRVAAQ